MKDESVLKYLQDRCPPIAKKTSIGQLTPIEDILVSIAWLADNANYGIIGPAKDLINKVLARELELAAMLTENKWYKDVIASEMGYSGPAGDAVCPLREWLCELKTQKSIPTATNVPMIEAACEAVLELTGYSIDGDTMREALQTALNVHTPHEAAGGVDERLETYDRLAGLITKYSNSILELDGANMDQAEIPLILSEFALEGLKVNQAKDERLKRELVEMEAIVDRQIADAGQARIELAEAKRVNERQSEILKKVSEFSTEILSESEAQFVKVVPAGELRKILMEFI